MAKLYVDTDTVINACKEIAAEMPGSEGITLCCMCRILKLSNVRSFDEIKAEEMEEIVNDMARKEGEQ